MSLKSLQVGDDLSLRIRVHRSIGVGIADEAHPVAIRGRNLGGGRLHGPVEWREDDNCNFVDGRGRCALRQGRTVSRVRTPVERILSFLWVLGGQPAFRCSNTTDTSRPHFAPSSGLRRVVRPELPVLYVYDHCPFCVRVRLAMGVKNVKHLIHFLANDDIATPTALVGKKIAPIFVSEKR